MIKLLHLLRTSFIFFISTLVVAIISKSIVLFSLAGIFGGYLIRELEEEICRPLPDPPEGM